MDTGQTGRQRTFEPEPAALPLALRLAARRPPKAGRTLVLDAVGQKVVVVLDEDGGDATRMWAFIQYQLSGGKILRM
jgi:hypothetical protein